MQQLSDFKNVQPYVCVRILYMHICTYTCLRVAGATAGRRPRLPGECASCFHSQRSCRPCARGQHVGQLTHRTPRRHSKVECDSAPGGTKGEVCESRWGSVRGVWRNHMHAQTCTPVSRVRPQASACAERRRSELRCRACQCCSTSVGSMHLCRQTHHSVHLSSARIQSRALSKSALPNTL